MVTMLDGFYEINPSYKKILIDFASCKAEGGRTAVGHHQNSLGHRQNSCGSPPEQLWVTARTAVGHQQNRS